MKKLYSGKVAGPTFYPAGERTKAGQTLRLVPEPDNPYDKHAIGVRNLNDEQVGHIPRKETAPIHAALAKPELNVECRAVEWIWPVRCNIVVLVTS